MSNLRIYFACKAIGIAPQSTTNFVTVHGLQSATLNTSFNIDQVTEIGQLETYQNIEDLPDIEMTLEKLLDGYPLVYHLATRGYSTGTLAGRSNRKCSVAMSLFGDTQDSASGVPVAQVTMSGMYCNSISYSMPADGNFTESVTLVGNHKNWISAGYTFSGTLFDNTDTPLSLASGTGGVQRRQHFLFDSLTDGSVTLLPGGTGGGIEGISSSGTNDKSGDVYGAHVQGVTVSTDLGRDNLIELGRRLPYHRFVNFPVDVTCEIETLSTIGDQVSATEDGTQGDGNNLAEKTIVIVLNDGTKIDLGTKNKLQSVTFGGGDATGGNDSSTYTYVNQNSFLVTHPQDPT